MEVYYIADIEQDIDDVIAVEYLQTKGVLRGVVLDPEPVTEEGKERVALLKAQGVIIIPTLPKCNLEYVINGGGFTKIAKHLETYNIGILFSNGGYVSGDHMDESQRLKKFEGKKEVRTYNFNIDVKSTISVLKSVKIKRHYLIGKNVCHNRNNTQLGIWKGYSNLNKWGIKPSKRLHDLLVCHEALSIITGRQTLLEYGYSEPYHTGENGNKTEWGTRMTDYSTKASAIQYRRLEINGV